MTTGNYATATPLIGAKSKIDAVQASAALTGTKVSISLVDADGKEIVNKGVIIAAIGQTAYNTLCASTLTALNTALTGAESTANTALAAL